MTDEILAKKEWEILEAVIEKYLQTEQPVSSLLLSREGEIELSPSMIRYYFWHLTREGLLCQPHISAGRLPTDRALALFINRVIEELEQNEEIFESFLSQINSWLEKENKEPEVILKNLSLKTKGLCFLYLLEADYIYKQGLRYLINCLNGLSQKECERVGQSLDELDDRIRSFKNKNNQEVSVYIGLNNPLIHHPRFSVILSPNTSWGILGLIGPKTILKQRNFGWFKAAYQTFQEIF